MGILERFINWIIDYGGLYILLLVVFAETGLLVGFLFPGDSLLFAAGIFLNKLSREFFKLHETDSVMPWHWMTIVIMVMIASVLGNIAGYWFGQKTGPLLYERRESWLFKKKHLMKAKAFYEKYGKPTIFVAKFLPFIRTFAPIVAGMVKMNRPIFMFYNIVGSIAWVGSMMLGGYFIDEWVKKRFGFSLQEHIEPITIGIILVTTLPVLYKIFFGRKEKEESSPESTNS
jgi:membrane-associated protein